MKNINLLISFLAFAIFIKGQNIQIEILKDTFKIDEKIEITYVIDSKVDSVIPPTLTYLYFSRVNSSTSVTSKDGNTEIYFRIKYNIETKNIGKTVLESPVFIIDGMEYRAENYEVYIDSKKLSKKELDDVNLDKFKDNSIKPNGTKRYVIFENYGYIEVFDEYHWKFYRNLSKKEIMKLNKVK